MAAFYNILLPTMSLFFSLGLTGLSDLLVSITRIQVFNGIIIPYYIYSFISKNDRLQNHERLQILNKVLYLICWAEFSTTQRKKPPTAEYFRTSRRRK